MDDAEIAQRISELADEEHRLEHADEGEGLSDPEQERLQAIEVALDQCWDLLRQRRARRHAGQDPDTAAALSSVGRRALPAVGGQPGRSSSSGSIRCPSTRPPASRSRPNVRCGWLRRCVGEPGLKSS